MEGHFEHDVVNGVAEGFPVRRAGADGDSGGSVGHDEDGVVGAHVAVDGDAVEGGFNGIAGEFFEVGACNGGIGGEEAEHGGHVRADHSCTFAACAEADGFALKGDFDGDFLFTRVGGDDGGGDVVSFVGGESCCEFGESGFNALHGHGQADDACGADGDFTLPDAEFFGDDAAFAAGDVDAFDSGAGVGIAAVGDDGPDVVAADVGLADADAGRADFVGGEGSGGCGRKGGVEKREVEARSGRLFDTAAQCIGDESLRCGDSALNGFHVVVRHDDGCGAEAMCHKGYGCARRKCGFYGCPAGTGSAMGGSSFVSGLDGGEGGVWSGWFSGCSFRRVRESSQMKFSSRMRRARLAASWARGPLVLARALAMARAAMWLPCCSRRWMEENPER